jgi:hypothetical protein
MATGTFCGPTPKAGNGLGPDGMCSGRETAPPCGSGAVLGVYYAYTLPLRRDGRTIFDGRRWVSELPPPTDMTSIHVWMALSNTERAGFISPLGAVGFNLAATDSGRAGGRSPC